MLMPLAFHLSLAANSGPDEFGFKPGTTSVYEVRAGGHAAERRTGVVVAQSVVQGMDVFDVKLDNGRHEYYGVSPTGLFQFAARNMDGTEVDAVSKPVPLYLRGKNPGDSWTWVEPFRGQTMAGPNGEVPDMEKLKSHCKASIVSDEASVTVPAGTFKALLVHITRRSEGLGESTDEIWIARGKGIVKRVVSHQTWRSETVLLEQK